MKDEKITAKFEPCNDEDFINIAYIITKFFKIEGHLSCKEKDYDAFKVLNNKQSVEKVLIEKPLKTTVPII